ncbi:GtrA family protein [Hyphococcus lacteus]|uniref:GtrA family protein n=1 Tax=Hyphococcus lacteus TaxID=3143536 RepID=A0ABV3Z2F3_9PROT
MQKMQIVKYGVAGLANTLVAFLTFSALIKFTPLVFWIANLLAIIASLISGFLLSRYFVFSAAIGSGKAQGWKYGVTFAIQYAVSTALIYAGIRAGASEQLAYILMLPFAISVSFCLQKFWVFKPT